MFTAGEGSNGEEERAEGASHTNGHENGSSGGGVVIPPHQLETVRLIGQHLADLGLQ